MTDKIGLPLICPEASCRYYGNLAVDQCPVCGHDLLVPDTATIKLLNRASMYYRMLESSSPAFVIGRQKTMIAHAAAEILSHEKEKYPAIPLDVDP